MALSREAARALTEAGYMPLDEYIRLYDYNPRHVPSTLGVVAIDGVGATIYNADDSFDPVYHFDPVNGVW